jgi:hypothetical protein
VSKVNDALANAKTPVVISSTAGTPSAIPVTAAVPLVVPAGKVLELHNVTLQVSTGAATTVKGSLNLGDKAKLEVQNGGKAEISGNVTVAAGGAVDFSVVPNTQTANKIVVSGTITVEKGGTFYSPAPGADANATPQLVYNATGKTVLKQGSTVYMNTATWGNIVQIGPSVPFATPPASTTAIYQWAASPDNGTIVIAQGGDQNIITLKSGTITTYGVPYEPGVSKTPTAWAIAGIQRGVIDKGATLIAAGTKGLQIDKELKVNGTLTANADITGDSSKPTNTVTITFGSTAPTGTNILNTFYNKGVKVTAPEKLVGRTYTWNSTAKRWENPNP